jgi:predicted outer membrane protein
VDAGNLAQQKGDSQAVKDFGAMMVKDHSAGERKASGTGRLEEHHPSDHREHW